MEKQLHFGANPDSGVDPDILCNVIHQSQWKNKQTDMDKDLHLLD